MSTQGRQLPTYRTHVLVAFVLAASFLLAGFFSGNALADVEKMPNEELPRVKVSTSEGELVIRLRPDVAPETVENFVQYVKSAQYEGTIFHRVIAGFMIQGGGYNAALEPIETRAPIANEATQTLPNIRGSVAMARTQAPDSATSQFFINLTDNAFLNPGGNGAGYAVFGTVVEGMGVVDAIASMPTETRDRMQNVPTSNVVIQSVSLLSDDTTATP